MQLNDLIDIYVSDLSKDEARKFTEQEKISETEIDDSICTFLDKLKNGAEIESGDFIKFAEQLKGLQEEVRNSILRMVFTIAHGIYSKHRSEIEIAVAVIDKSLKDSQPIPQDSANAKKYIDLINIYHLFAQNISISSDGNTYNSFPGVNPYQRKTLASKLPFAINALTLTGKLPKANYNGVNTAKALYPLDLNVAKDDKVPIKKGIKISDAYYPYKAVSKIAKGDTGDNTFLATNGTKALFMRGVGRYAPQGILASKIATLVSATHFSSERLMDNRIVASKGIKAYACSVADGETRTARKQYIEKDNKVFPGTGIIDEVCNYVNETDPNIENLGFSSTEIEKAHLSKIDFDLAFPSIPKTKESYERNIVTQSWNGIYKNLPHVQQDKNYIHEKLYARLKLSMITESLLSGMADKAFTKEDQEKRDKSIKACIDSSGIALALFLEHKDAKQFIKDNPHILTQCYTEIEHYIKKHFEVSDQQKMINSLKDRVQYIYSQQVKQWGAEHSAPPILGEKQKEEAEHSTLPIPGVKEKEERVLQTTYYQYEVDDRTKGRGYHALEVTGEKFSDLKQHLKGLKGDHLKSVILLELKEELKSFKSEEKLNSFIQTFQNEDPRFKVLNTAQGIATRLGLFGLKTSSIQAFNKMVEEQRTIIKENSAGEAPPTKPIQ
jgi:hypothetical protein